MVGEQAPHSVRPRHARGIEDVHVDALMTIIHALTSAGSTRPTNELDIRQRLVVQTLGLHGPQAIVGIGTRLGLSPSTMTGIIDRLETLAVISRSPHPSDRRVTLVQLTNTGIDVFDQERAFYNSLLDATLSGLDTASTDAVLNALGALAALDQEITT